MVAVKTSSLSLLQDNQVISLKTFCKEISYFTSLECLRATEDNSSECQKKFFLFISQQEVRSIHGRGLSNLLGSAYTDHFPTMAHYRGKQEIQTLGRGITYMPLVKMLLTTERDEIQVLLGSSFFIYT